MKNSKKYILLPVAIFVFSFILIRIVGVSYSASNTSYNYQYIRRNMLSHHFISSNGGNASGTILLKTGNRSSNSGSSVLVYCARQGKTINGSGGYSKQNLKNAFNDTKSKRLTAVLANSYPYISLAELKEVLKNESIGIGSQVYTENLFDTLDVQEAMTATQAAVWNIIGNTEKYKYGTTKRISSVSYMYFNGRRSVDWNKCSSYNFQGFGAKSTKLQPGDTEKNVCAYKSKGTQKLDTRINELIKWYLSLTTIDELENDVVNFEYSNAVWTDNGKTLTVDIKAVGDLDYSNSDYKITFNDLNGKQISNTSITETKILENNDVKGYKYVINDIPTRGINVLISVVKKGMPKKAYYYAPKNNGSQAMIGIDDGDITISNELNILNNGNGEITIYKVKDSKSSVTTNASNNVNLCLENKNCLDGAYMALYSSDKTTVIREFVSSSSNPEIITGLPAGTYYVKELTPPIGYLLNEEFYEIVIEEDGKVIVTINNDPTKICFKKVSSEDKTLILDGAKFRIEGAEGGTFEEFYTSSQQETYCIEGQLESGYYYLIEEEAPKNYAKPNTIFKFEVGKFNPEDITDELIPESEEDNIVVIESVNNIITIENDPGVVITKTDLSTGACVSGAKLEVKDNNGNIVDSWTSSCIEGKDTYQLNLEPGTYTLTETITPKGYATSETIEFTIDSNGKVNKSLNMKDAPIEVCFLKTSKDSEEGLPGAEFEIYNEDGTLYNKFVTDYLPTCFPYMPIGNYTVKEIKAPDGYQIINEETKITVKDTDERQMFEIENEVLAPKTDMDYSKVLIIVASIFMIFGLGLVTYYGYKKHI